MPTPKFEKGRAKTGGRKKGSPNKVTENIKALMLETVFPRDRIVSEFEFFLKHRDPYLRWKAFELGLAYGFGKPALPVKGTENAPPVHIDISAIPRKRALAD